MTTILLCLVFSTLSLEPLTEKLQSIEYLTGGFVQTDYWALTMIPRNPGEPFTWPTRICSFWSTTTFREGPPDAQATWSSP